MKLLTATSQAQGQRASDFTWCVEGEIVMRTALICDRDREEGPDGGCGCGRSFIGLNSHKGTTTAMVRDVAGFTLDDLIEALRSSYQQAGWGELGDRAAVLAENLAGIASEHAGGTILELRLEDIEVRPGLMPWDNSPEKRRRDSRTYGPQWRRARAAQLKLQPACELRYAGICQGRADTVDHVLGADADPHHTLLRSACAPCHRKRTANEQGGGYRSVGRQQMPDPAPRPATRW